MIEFLIFLRYMADQAILYEYILKILFMTEEQVI